jgi:hypothetical protein
MTSNPIKSALGLGERLSEGEPIIVDYSTGK